MREGNKFTLNEIMKVAGMIDNWRELYGDLRGDAEGVQIQTRLRGRIFGVDSAEIEIRPTYDMYIPMDEGRSSLTLSYFRGKDVLDCYERILESYQETKRKRDVERERERGELVKKIKGMIGGGE